MTHWRLTMLKLLSTCVLVVLLLPFGGTVTADAATLQAASCARDAVAAAVGRAVNGDTVQVPAGPCAWTSGVAISKAITLQGAGSGATVITNNYTTGHLIAVTESTAGSVKIQGFSFAGGLGPQPEFFYLNVAFTPNGKPVVVRGNQWTMGGGGNAMRFQTNRGVVSGNSATATPGGGNCLNNAGFIRHKPSRLAASWTTPSAFGAADTNGDLNLYVEDNVITNVMEGIDVDDNARTVIRKNRITNSGLVTHGADTSAIGGRYMDIYGNTFVWDTAVVCPPDLPANVNSFIFLRGGTALIHDNVIPDVTSQAWGNKSEIGFIVENLRRNAGPYPCWTQGYPAPHQAGWGYTTGGTQAGKTGVRQDLEPVYLWNNTGGGNYGNPGVGDYGSGECGPGAGSSATYVQAGREYFVNTPKPGYTPYVYPHPLASGVAP